MSDTKNTEETPEYQNESPKTSSYVVTNDTDETFVIYEVGRFEPGETELELNADQVNLLKDNAILSFSKASSASKSESKSDTPNSNAKK